MSLYADTSIMEEAYQKGLHFIYPETDGEPMAENTTQFEWIVLIKSGLDAAFADRDDVFIAGDLLWYPEEGKPELRMAPDVLAVVGRPKGHRGSYLQWQEEKVPIQVVFEILSPGNRYAEMRKKFNFYQKYGVEEYYLYDPFSNDLEIYVRAGELLIPVPADECRDWTSPLLGIRLEWTPDTLTLFRPDGKRFLNYVELSKFGDTVEKLAEEQKQRAEEERQRAEEERQRAEEERQRAEAAELRAVQMAETLRKLGIDPDQI